MTLVNIITQALTELGRTTDAQQMEAWKDKFTVFVNDGMRDIAEYLELRKTDTVTAAAGKISVSDLSDACVKVVSVTQNGSEIPFNMGNTSNEIEVPGEGVMQVEYRYIPHDLRNNTDKPGIPEHLHHLLVSYVVYREHMTADPTMQRRSNAFYQMYETGKRQAKKNLGEADTYSIYNVGW